MLQIYSDRLIPQDALTEIFARLGIPAHDAGEAPRLSQNGDALFVRAGVAVGDAMPTAFRDTPAWADFAADPQVSVCGSADLFFRRDDALFCTNTAYLGLFAAAHRAGIVFGDRKAVILGGDSVARSAARLAKDLGAKEVVLLSRTADGVYDTAAHHDAQILIAAEPSDAADTAADLSVFPYLESVMELCAFPLRSRLLLAAEERDCRTVGGLYVAAAQAAIAAGRIRGLHASPDEIDTVYKSLLEENANITLIGMDGCGAAQIAQELSDTTGREVVRIPAIRESVVAAGALRGKILLPAEDVVTRSDNLHPLLQNGRVFFLLRPLDALDTSLSADERRARYRDLLPQLSAFCDETVSWAGDAASTARAILSSYRKNPYRKRG